MSSGPVVILPYRLATGIRFSVQSMFDQVIVVGAGVIMSNHIVRRTQRMLEDEHTIWKCDVRNRGTRLIKKGGPNYER